MAKFTVSEFLKRLTERFWKKGYERGLQGIRVFLVVTFFFVFIATLVECHPTNHYWQVIPDPGPQCRQGFVQLLTMGVADIITDILLVVFPIPIILRSGMPFKRKLSLCALFSMSLVLITITGARMPLVIERRGIQQFRTVFASSEIVAATIVSNAIILGSFLRDRGIKKTRFKAPSTTDSMERRGSTRRFTDHTCSSDEDLARSLGYRTKPELQENGNPIPRPAPVADLDMLSGGREPGPFANNDWNFPSQDGKSGNEAKRLRVDDVKDPMPSPRTGRRVSWFDVGGLLEDSSPTDSVITHDFAQQPPQPRRGSRASNGRTYPAPARRSSRLSQQSGDHEMAARPHQLFQDRDGLFSEAHEQEAVHTMPPLRPRSSTVQTPRPELMAPLRRSSTRTSYDTPSLRDPGGLLSAAAAAPPASMRRISTHTSYDTPSLQDAGGLLSSPAES